MFWNWVVGRVFNYNAYYSLLMCGNYGHRTAGMANKDGGRLGGWWFALRKAGFGDYPPPTPGWRKNRGRVPGPGRLYFSAIQNHLLRTGGTGKTGGHDF